MLAYWLYKLHGLGIEFKCEICGNYRYMNLILIEVIGEEDHMNDISQSGAIRMV